MKVAGCTELREEMLKEEVAARLLNQRTAVLGRLPRPAEIRRFDFARGAGIPGTHLLLWHAWHLQLRRPNAPHLLSRTYISSFGIIHADQSHQVYSALSIHHLSRR